MPHAELLESMVGAQQVVVACYLEREVVEADGAPSLVIVRRVVQREERDAVVVSVAL